MSGLLGVAGLEAGHAATGVEDLLLAGVEGVAVGADLGVDGAARRGAASRERVAAGAGHLGGHVLGVDVLLHGFLSGSRPPGRTAIEVREPEPASKCAIDALAGANRRAPAQQPTEAACSHVAQVRARRSRPVASRAQRVAGEDRGDPRGELARAERLDDVVVGAGLEALLDVGLLGAGGQHDDRQAVHVGVLPQRAGGVEAAHAGHHHVEDDQVGLLGGARLDGCSSVTDRDDLVPAVTQLEHDEFADVRVVVSNHDASHVCFPSECQR